MGEIITEQIKLKAHCLPKIPKIMSFTYAPIDIFKQKSRSMMKERRSVLFFLCQIYILIGSSKSAKMDWPAKMAFIILSSHAECTC